jgi:selenoprotein W-related protein
MLNQFKSAVGEVALVPSSGGAFEVSVDGLQVFSKLASGKFPSESAVIGDVAAKL